MPEIKERPILFSAPMVRAILEGRKTVTRRALNAQSLKNIGYGVQLGECHELPSEGPLHPNSIGYYIDFCPFGQPGDRLWVRETFGLQVRNYGGGTGEHILYRATNPDAIYCKSAEGQEYPVKWKPSIHMPRHSSRILLEITDVRIERLQDISEAQALAEGIVGVAFRPDDGWPICTGYMVGPDDGKTGLQTTAAKAFAGLWDSVGGNWNANPWVWVVEFKRVTP
ncbi:hypothetical protein [Pseudomonas yamanorum]|uniref:hypothetical protein n=1 Tax=Pseudomonas yamanorum TaxID=515393 RepID=UPI003B9FE195